jgi:transglutaminase-like putative cysteine protease
MHLHTLSFVAAASLAVAPNPGLEPKVVETRTVNLTQTVTLRDIPTGAKQVRMWVPVPSDAAWQRVVDRKVVSAPGSWKLLRQDQGRGDFVYVELDNPQTKEATVEFSCVVQTEGVQFPIEKAGSVGEVQPAIFKDDLDVHAPLMEADDRVKALADKACGDERDIARQALLLMKAVADNADHYSKDATKPKCGRGAAGDCMDHGGGCCTDLHSLFIAMARETQVWPRRGR